MRSKLSNWLITIVIHRAISSSSSFLVAEEPQTFPLWHLFRSLHCADTTFCPCLLSVTFRFCARRSYFAHYFARGMKEKRPEWLLYIVTSKARYIVFLSLGNLPCALILRYIRPLYSYPSTALYHYRSMYRFVPENVLSVARWSKPLPILLHLGLKKRPSSIHLEIY